MKKEKSQLTDRITIPPEAVKALRTALTACDCDECVTVMIRAVLEDWPGMEIEHDTWREPRTLHLPLPQKENSDE